MAVVDQQTKKRFLRRLNTRRKGAAELSQQADQQIDKLLLRRFNRLVSVKRFVFLWVGLFVILFFTTFAQSRDLSHYYQVMRPVPGGLYTEGLVGTFTNANPLYASGAADVGVSRLVFAGLFKYDSNNRLVGDMASDYRIDKTQKRYIVHLRKNIVWHDGKPFTADDVLYTYHTIQNLRAQSALYASWRDITVSSLDEHTVIFDLPNALSSFPHALTNGIVPKHLLQNIPPEQLRSAAFNTKPIGTGPFSWRSVEVSGSVSSANSDRRQRIALAAFNKYWHGKPKLDGFNLLTFTDENKLVEAFKEKQINAISGLESLPAALEGDSSVQAYVTPLTSVVMAFMNNSRPALNNVNVRKALVSGVDVKKSLTLTPYATKRVEEPFLKGQIGYDHGMAELPYNTELANKLLDGEGYKRGPDGMRLKDGKPLAFNLSSQNTENYSITAKYLQKEWAKLGVKVTVNYYEGEELQGSIIGNHDYDILLYGISLGVDPDMFPYWDSSQANINSQGHLNLSEYKSSVADQALQAGRTRADEKLRAIKYKEFLKAWRKDAPALALYQPNFLYISRGAVYNYGSKEFNSAADRYNSVDQWMIRQKRQNVN
ncbi:MAG TPA: peptide ABC transporter substrate-binding protein [Candidatus Saccharimonadales bacterium]|nr:peptide ABC transporter substrate-binding protein [Candidatus Saccharimonadales bacterium]